MVSKSPTIITKPHTRLRVKAVELPLSLNRMLGTGIDVTTLPEGHLACTKCQGPYFECWVYLDNHRLEMGCIKCNASYRLLFPLDVSLSPFGNQGRFTCKKHPKKGLVLIHNIDVISVGCECCFREVRITLKSKSNLVLADD